MYFLFQRILLDYYLIHWKIRKKNYLRTLEEVEEEKTIIINMSLSLFSLTIESTVLYSL